AIQNSLDIIEKKKDIIKKISTLSEQKPSDASSIAKINKLSEAHANEENKFVTPIMEAIQFFESAILVYDHSLKDQKYERPPRPTQIIMCNSRIAECYKELGNDILALEYYQKALDEALAENYDHLHWFLLLERGLFSLEKRKTLAIESAIVDFQKALSSPNFLKLPENDDALDKGATRRLLQKIIDTWVSIIHQSFLRENYIEIINYSKECLKFTTIDPNCIGNTIEVYLFVAYFKLKDYPKALVAINKAIEKESNDATLYIHRAKFYLAQDNIPEAWKDFIKAKQCNSSNKTNKKNIYEMEITLAIKQAEIDKQNKNISKPSKETKKITIQDTKLIQNTKLIKNPKLMSNTKLIKNPQLIPNNKLVKETSIQDSNLIREIKLTQQPNMTSEISLTNGIKANDSSSSNSVISQKSSQSKLLKQKTKKTHKKNNKYSSKSNATPNKKVKRANKYEKNKIEKEKRLKNILHEQKVNIVKKIVSELIDCSIQTSEKEMAKREQKIAEAKQRAKEKDLMILHTKQIVLNLVDKAAHIAEAKQMAAEKDLMILHTKQIVLNLVDKAAHIAEAKQMASEKDQILVKQVVTNLVDKVVQIAEARQITTKSELMFVQKQVTTYPMDKTLRLFEEKTSNNIKSFSTDTSTEENLEKKSYSSHGIIQNSLQTSLPKLVNGVRLRKNIMSDIEFHKFCHLEKRLSGVNANIAIIGSSVLVYFLAKFKYNHSLLLNEDIDLQIYAEKNVQEVTNILIEEKFSYKAGSLKKGYTQLIFEEQGLRRFEVTVIFDKKIYENFRYDPIDITGCSLIPIKNLRGEMCFIFDENVNLLKDALAKGYFNINLSGDLAKTTYLFSRIIKYSRKLHGILKPAFIFPDGNKIVMNDAWNHVAWENWLHHYFDGLVLENDTYFKEII
ncbi:MAG: hypothetical protein JO131_05005, partial [Gammaproteobacteria bacterium]|nr:hypothetical protein [Gammaproteobacteria bacterium]